MRNTGIFLLFFVLLGSDGALCHDGRTPVLTLDLGATLALDAADLGLGEDLVGVEIKRRPAELRCEIDRDRRSLRITAWTPLPWGVLETGAGDIFCRTSAKRPVRFEYRDTPGRRDVRLFGSFNSWNRESHAFIEKAPGVYEIEVLMDPGDHEYLIKAGESELRDPSNPDSVGNGFGGWNSLLRISPPGGDRPLLLRLGREGARVRFLLRRFEEGRSVPQKVRVPEDVDVMALQGNRRIADEFLGWSGDTLTVHMPRPLEGADAGIPAPGGPADLLRVCAVVGGHPTPLQTVFLDEAFRWEDAVFYALMPDRFRNGDPANDRPVIHPELEDQANWRGGDLAGILQAMEEGYLDSLGINAVWIYPLNRSTDKAWREYPEPHRWYTGYHGYWPVESRELDPRFGTEDQFRRLVEAAHARGIRVILDLVVNHVHREHPWVREHPDWFTELELPDGSLNLRRWDSHRLTTWFEPYMPDVDYSGSDAALEEATDDALWWIRRFDLDGFRHDAVKHVPRRFWKRLTEKLREGPAAERSLYQIGETFGSDELIASYVGPGVLDAQFNFNLFHPVRRLFLDEGAPFGRLGLLLERNLEYYGRNHLMGNLMDSHDKARYMAFADGDLVLDVDNTAERAWRDAPAVSSSSSYDAVELYLCYMLTIPGIPFLYYGDEIGMTGAGDPDNRRMMRFGPQLTADEGKLLRRVRELVGMRRERPELRRGDFLLLHEGEDTVAWLRSAEDGAGKLSRSLVALNRGRSPRSVKVRDPLSGRILSMDVPPRGWRIMHP